LLVRWNKAFAEICEPKFQILAEEGAFPFLKTLLGRDDSIRQMTQRYSAEVEIGRRTVQLSVNPINGDSQERILILNDITDRKLADYALRTAEKLASTGKLANAIAHEINNPLEALTNLIYLASSSSSLSDVHNLLSTAHNELARISRITKQSLSFHRDSERAISIDVGELVADVVSVFERSAAQRRVRLAFSHEPAAKTCGFPGQLRQVFGNLIRNATEAAPPGSEVAIRVRSIQRSGNKGVRITIHDCGAGIPDVIQEKLFDPFFTTKDLKGSGLGLWVSKTLVVKHRGTIRFRSCSRIRKSGTTFEVYLPSRMVEWQDA
jgi:signal transduction histidine kinase